MKNLKTLAFVMLCLFGFAANIQANEKQKLIEEYKNAQKIIAENMAILRSTDFEIKDYSCKQFKAIIDITWGIPKSLDPVAPMIQFPDVFKNFVRQLQHNLLINQFQANELNNLYSALTDRTNLQRALCNEDYNQSKRYYKDALTLDIHDRVYTLSAEEREKYSLDPELMQRRVTFLTKYIKRKRFYTYAMKNRKNLCSPRTEKFLKALIWPKKITSDFTDLDRGYFRYFGSVYSNFRLYAEDRCDDMEGIVNIVTANELMQMFQTIRKNAPLSYEAKIAEAETLSH